MSVQDTVALVEKELAMPLPDEVSAAELERARRARVGEENRGPVERLMGIMELPQRAGE